MPVMAEQLHGSAYGVSVRFDVASELVPEVAELLPPGWSSEAVPDDAPCWTIRTLEEAGMEG